MSGFKEYGDYDGLGLAALVKSKDVKPEELLEEAINRTEALNGELNAVTQKFYDRARRQIADGLPDGAFKGVPYLLKDLHLLLEGTATTSSCKLFKDNVADHNSTLTDRLLKGGLVMYGKTNTPEFGNTTTTEPQMFGPCRNPWNLDHATGGSSGGAASAVAARILPMAHASDGGGSIRIPAAACGLFGMKPTRARTPSGPDRGEGWNGCAISHAVSLTVRDNAALLDISTGPAEGDIYDVLPQARPYVEEVDKDPGRLRIAYSTRTPLGTPLDPECKAAVELVAKRLADLGHDVEEAWPDYSPEEVMGALVHFIGAHTAATLALRAEALGVELKEDDVERQTWSLAQMGKMITGENYARAQVWQQKAARDLGAFFGRYDAFLQPTLGTPPAKLGWLDMHSEDQDSYIERIGLYSPFTALYNITGSPSMNVPQYWTDGSLPVGTMISAAHGREDTLFRLAGQLERAHPWIDRKPPTSA